MGKIYFVTCLQVKVIGPDSKPVASEPVNLFVNESHNITLTTDKTGTAPFSLDTSLWTGSVNLRVGYNHFVVICGRSVQFKGFYKQRVGNHHFAIKKWFRRSSYNFIFMYE